MPIYKITLNKFYGGVADDIVAPNAAEYAGAVGLDDLTQSGRLSPYRSYVDRSTGGSNLRRVVMGSDGTVYALGEVSGANASTTVYTKTALSDASWTLSASASVGNAQSQAFAEDGNYFYSWDSNGAIDRYSIRDASFENGWQNPSGATSNNVGPIFHHSNGNTYFAYGNIIAEWDRTTFTAIALDLPPGFQIIDLTEQNSYLVIAAAWGEPITSTFNPNKSKVFFWDTVNTSTYQFAKSIPEGTIIACQNIGDEIAVISLLSGGGLSQDGKAFAYTYNGGQFQLQKKLIVPQNTDSSGFAFRGQHIQVKNNQLYFVFNLGGVKGVWRFGKNNGVYCLKRDRFLVNVTDDTDFDQIRTDAAIGFVGDYLCAITAVGTFVCMTNANTYSATGYYESPVIGGGKQYETKDLLSVAIVTRGLPASASVLVRYRVDAESSWTTIGTHSSGVFSEFADELPKGWNLIQFRLETTGNAEITELTALYESRLNIKL